uniref:Uncharacterized protein n=1 Tax=viral metagenome TaxID=1070528 RepID=A0A6M3LMZ7_9ZZZZ
MTLEIAETASNMWESERKLWKEYAQKLKKFWGSSLVDEVHQRIAEAVMWRDLWKVWPIYCEYIRILTDKLEEDPKDVH